MRKRPPDDFLKIVLDDIYRNAVYLEEPLRRRITRDLLTGLKKNKGMNRNEVLAGTRVDYSGLEKQFPGGVAPTNLFEVQDILTKSFFPGWAKLAQRRYQSGGDFLESFQSSSERFLSNIESKYQGGNVTFYGMRSGFYGARSSAQEESRNRPPGTFSLEALDPYVMGGIDPSGRQWNTSDAPTTSWNAAQQAGGYSGQRSGNIIGGKYTNVASWVQGTRGHIVDLTHPQVFGNIGEWNRSVQGQLTELSTPLADPNFMRGRSFQDMLNFQTRFERLQSETGKTPAQIAKEYYRLYPSMGAFNALNLGKLPYIGGEEEVIGYNAQLFDREHFDIDVERKREAVGTNFVDMWMQSRAGFPTKLQPLLPGFDETGSRVLYPGNVHDPFLADKYRFGEFRLTNSGTSPYGPPPMPHPFGSRTDPYPPLPTYYKDEYLPDEPQWGDDPMGVIINNVTNKLQRMGTQAYFQQEIAFELTRAGGGKIPTQASKAYYVGREGKKPGAVDWFYEDRERQSQKYLGLAGWALYNKGLTKRGINESLSNKFAELAIYEANSVLQGPREYWKSMTAVENWETGHSTSFPEQPLWLQNAIFRMNLEQRNLPGRMKAEAPFPKFADYGSGFNWSPNFSMMGEQRREEAYSVAGSEAGGVFQASSQYGLQILIDRGSGPFSQFMMENANKLAKPSHGIGVTSALIGHTREFTQAHELGHYAGFIIGGGGGVASAAQHTGNIWQNLVGGQEDLFTRNYSKNAFNSYMKQGGIMSIVEEEWASQSALFGLAPEVQKKFYPWATQYFENLQPFINEALQNQPPIFGMSLDETGPNPFLQAKLLNIPGDVRAANQLARSWRQRWASGSMRARAPGLNNWLSSNNSQIGLGSSNESIAVMVQTPSGRVPIYEDTFRGPDWAEISPITYARAFRTALATGGTINGTWHNQPLGRSGMASSADMRNLSSLGPVWISEGGSPARMQAQAPRRITVPFEQRLSEEEFLGETATPVTPYIRADQYGMPLSSTTRPVAQRASSGGGNGLPEEPPDWPTDRPEQDPVGDEPGDSARHVGRFVPSQEVLDVMTRLGAGRSVLLSKPMGWGKTEIAALSASIKGVINIVEPTSKLASQIASRLQEQNDIQAFHLLGDPGYGKDRTAYDAAQQAFRKAVGESIDPSTGMLRPGHKPIAAVMSYEKFTNLNKEYGAGSTILNFLQKAIGVNVFDEASQIVNVSGSRLAMKQAAASAAVNFPDTPSLVMSGGLTPGNREERFKGRGSRFKE